jgi:hypothetical protein
MRSHNTSPVVAATCCRAEPQSSCAALDQRLYSDRLFGSALSAVGTPLETPSSPTEIPWAMPELRITPIISHMHVGLAEASCAADERQAGAFAN